MQSDIALRATPPGVCVSAGTPHFAQIGGSHNRLERLAWPESARSLDGLDRPGLTKQITMPGLDLGLVWSRHHLDAIATRQS
jgi:hypothetical protein